MFRGHRCLKGNLLAIGWEENDIYLLSIREIGPNNPVTTEIVMDLGPVNST